MRWWHVPGVLLVLAAFGAVMQWLATPSLIGAVAAAAMGGTGYALLSKS